MQNHLAALGNLMLAMMSAVSISGEPSQDATELAAQTGPATAIATRIDDSREALRDASGGMTISGFFDVNATSRSSASREVTFGSFELGLARPVGSRAELAGAIVMNEEGARLTTGVLDVRLSPTLEATDGPYSLRLQIGRFDVPFGSDWKSYAAKDRVGISAPLTTTTILDGGLNAIGVNLAGSRRIVDYALFALYHGEQTKSGGRLGLSSPGMTVGMSFLQSNARSAGEGPLIGIDSELQAGRFRVRAERIERHGADGGVPASGWHVTLDAAAATGRNLTLTPFVRYDASSSGTGGSLDARDGGNRERRLTAGLNTTVAQMLTFKLEFQRDSTRTAVATQEEASKISWLAQLVVFF